MTYQCQAPALLHAFNLPEETITDAQHETLVVTNLQIDRLLGSMLNHPKQWLLTPAT